MGSLLEIVFSVLLLAIGGTAILGGLSTATRASVVLEERTYAEALAASVLQNAEASPYASSYPTSGPAIPNPKAYPVTLEVLHYDPTKTPPFSASYADSGLEELVVSVTTPDRRVITLSTYKSR